MESDPVSRTFERITKLDAAKRQLRTAIRLFFAEGDPVSIHTLAAASHEVLRAIAMSRGYRSFLKDSDLIRPEGAKEYYSIVNAPQNFFKHADRDLDATLDFKTEWTPFFLFDCAVMYKSLTGRDFRESWVFAMWFTLKYPRILKPGPLRDSAEKTIAAGTLTKALCLEIIEQPEKWPQANLE